jgi:hypothetical protein
MQAYERYEGKQYYVCMCVCPHTLINAYTHTQTHKHINFEMQAYERHECKEYYQDPMKEIDVQKLGNDLGAVYMYVCMYVCMCTYMCKES